MKLTIIVLFSTLFSAHAQTDAPGRFKRKGFVAGAAVGISSINLAVASGPDQKETSLSLPNFKFGMMASPKTAVLLYLPGTIYTFHGTERERDRGFEGIVPSVQHWLYDRWWIMAGAGLGLDAPAFYDIKNESERKFYFGSSLVAGTGYEIWRKKNYAFDVQGRVHYVSAEVQDGKQKGMAVSLLVGFNLY